MYPGWTLLVDHRQNPPPPPEHFGHTSTSIPNVRSASLSHLPTKPPQEAAG